MTSDNEAVGAWNRTECINRPLNLAATLAGGQAFRWRTDSAGIWWGTIGTTAVAMWQRIGDSSAPLYWQTFPQRDRRTLVETYLGLDIDVVGLYSDWIEAEPRIQHAVAEFHGLRILRQPTLECFIAFQCATCNTVVKIERSVGRLASRYGMQIAVEPSCLAVVHSHADHAGSTPYARPHSPGQTTRANDFNSGEPPPLRLLAEPLLPLFVFPEVEVLADANEADLRSDLWGYRAPRVISLARHLLKQSPNWLEDMRHMPYAKAKEALVELSGVGEKIADCICLFCLDKDEAVPVDTHVRQIACSLFLPQFREKSLTPRIYSAIGDAYRDRFGAFAGWAQQYLFLGAMRARQLKTHPV